MNTEMPGIRPTIEPPPSPENLLPPRDVIVIGAGPGGLVASILLRQLGVPVTCLEFRDVFSPQPEGEGGRLCNGCGGAVQRQLLDELSRHGIDLHQLGAVRAEIGGFAVHHPLGNRPINITPVSDPAVAVYRGGIPAGDATETQAKGLDQALAEIAQAAGVEFIQAKVTRVELKPGEGAVVTATQVNTGQELQLTADFLVGAFAHSPLVKNIVDAHGNQCFEEPVSQTSAVMELNLGSDFCHSHIGDQMHVVVIPHQLAGDMRVRFAAVIPKGNGLVSLVFLGGGNIKKTDAYQFLESEFAHNLIPQTLQQSLQQADSPAQKDQVLAAYSPCNCWGRRITVVPPGKTLTILPGKRLQGAVLIGDGGDTRPYKNGLWGAIMGAIIAVETLFKQRNPPAFETQMSTLFPSDDFDYAHLLMDFNDYWLSHRWFASLLEFVNRRHIPLLTQEVNRFTLHLLIGDIPYKKILPAFAFPLIRKFLALTETQTKSETATS